MKHLILLATISLLLFACSKDDNDVQRIRLKSIGYSTGENVTCTYTNDRMSSETFTSGSNSIVSTFTEFDAQNRLTKYFNRDYSIQISYIDGTNYWEKSYFNLATGSLYAKYKIQKIGNTVEVSRYTAAGSFTEKYVYIFDTGMNNVLGYEIYDSDDDKIQSRIYSNFDNKKTPNEFYPVGFFFVNQGKNNYSTFTDLLTSGGVAPTSCSNEYNEQGYVVRKVFSTGLVVTYQYETY